jgi:hypothetical protein
MLTFSKYLLARFLHSRAIFLDVKGKLFISNLGENPSRE